MDLFGGLFGMIGSVAGAAISAAAIRDATERQIAALERQRDFVFENLDPSMIGAQATEQDIRNAYARMALQAQIDPALARIRGTSQNMLEDQLAGLGQGGNDVAAQATAEALSGTDTAKQAKQALIDAGLANLQAGATLPPDVQAEFMKAGLEQSGMTTGGASGKGVGGQLLRTVLGTAGLNLQKQREQQAAALFQGAQDLESRRQQTLQSLFPSLTQNQLQIMGGTTGALSASEALKPTAGLTGSDISNLWLARVGATNQLAQSSADIGARAGIATGQIWGNALSGGLGSLGRGLSGWLGNDTK
jgi:hypothetical protein